MQLINIGDCAECTLNGIRGTVSNIYYPTASAQQIMVTPLDGRLYHAPAVYWRKTNGGGDCV